MSQYDKAYDKAEALYELNKDKIIDTEQFQLAVCGFHYPWDDKDDSSIIAAVTNTKGNQNGMFYSIQGDVYMTHQHNPYGYLYIPIDDFDKYGLLQPEKSL